MTRERAKELLEVIEWWLNGGNLWYCNHYGIWIKIDDNYDLEFSNDSLYYVIEDKHFESRKAYALRKPIEYRLENSNTAWNLLKCENELWLQFYEYRVYRPKWYEIEKNIGKVIMVRDDSYKRWVPRIFMEYKLGDSYPFKTDKLSWKLGRLITMDDIADTISEDEEDLVKNPK